MTIITWFLLALAGFSAGWTVGVFIRQRRNKVWSEKPTIGILVTLILILTFIVVRFS